MADLNEIMQQLAFARGGGYKPNPTEEINKTLGNVNTMVQNNMAVKKMQLDMIKSSLESKKLQIEAEKANAEKEKIQQESQPLSEQLVAPQVKAKLGQTFSADIPVEDLVSGKLDTTQQGIDKAKEIALKGQETFGDMTPLQYKEMQQGQAFASLAPKRAAETAKIESDPSRMTIGELYPSMTNEQIATRFGEGVDSSTLYNQALSMGKLKQGTDKATQTQLSSDAIKMMAHRALSGMVDPMGLGTKIRIPIMNAMAEMSAATGDTVGSQAVRKASMQASQQELSNLQKQRGIVMAFEKTAMPNLDNMLAVAGKIPETKTEFFNKPVRELVKYAGNENIAAFLAAQQVAATEIGKVLQGGMGSILTNEARQEASKTLNPNYTVGQIISAANILKSDMQNRKEGYDAQIAENKANIYDLSEFGNREIRVQPNPIAKVPLNPVQSQSEPYKIGDIKTNSSGQKAAYMGSGKWRMLGK